MTMDFPRTHAVRPCTTFVTSMGSESRLSTSTATGPIGVARHRGLGGAGKTTARAFLELSPGGSQGMEASVKAVILAGGLGTRLSEETSTRPKPMVEIGGKPILWHIMKLYSAHGINDFVVCLGYKGYVIKEYFRNYFLHNSDVTFDLRNNEMKLHRNDAEPWSV